jgi:asparagine synthase (glutamine-hydrolysing)
MCGIAGYWGPFGREKLAGMVAAISHRGPDGSGVELVDTPKHGGAVGLGHCRLAIIDLTAGQQPMWNADHSLAIIFNGEIYNYQTLRRDLEKRGARFLTRSDTEVILEGWRIDGEKILPQLEGMFAFGIWDGRTEEWILARDRWGIKPLYLAQPAGGTIAFASEIKPLLSLTGKPRLNMRAFYEYLLYSWCAGPDTIFEGIRHLAPGHVVRWKPNDRDIRSRQFASVREGAGSPPDRAEMAAALRAEFDRSVSNHLIADVPVGLTLSGGLDSSAVLASVARSQDLSAVDTFTIGFGRDDDETPFARAMAQHLGARHHIRTVSPDGIAADFTSIVRTLEEPIAHPVLQTTYEAARFAREKVKVVLIGEGSDELFLGYPQYKTLIPPLSFLPASQKARLYLAVCCLMPRASDIENMLAPEFLDRTLLHEVAAQFDPYFESGNFAEGAQRFEIEKPLLANQLLRIDKLTMAFGLEARVPFLDNRFGALALSLPVSAKLAGGRSKAVFRDAMAERLPSEILYRPKTGKGGTQALLPFLQDLVKTGPLSGLVSDRALASRGWLRPEAVRDYLAQANGPLVRLHPIESRRRSKFHYALAVIEQWGRLYLD